MRITLIIRITFDELRIVQRSALLGAGKRVCRQALDKLARDQLLRPAIVADPRLLRAVWRAPQRQPDHALRVGAQLDTKLQRVAAQLAQRDKLIRHERAPSDATLLAAQRGKLRQRRGEDAAVRSGIKKVCAGSAKCCALL